MVAVAVTRGLSFFEPQRLKQTCKLCTREECQGFREMWGCDAPTAQPQLWIPCVACDGREQTCESCSGGGFEALYRCPQTFVTDEAREFVELFQVYPQALPLSGGLYEQPDRYLIAMRIIARAHACLDAEEAARSQRRTATNA
jgi:hypothetical protein